MLAPPVLVSALKDSLVLCQVRRRLLGGQRRADGASSTRLDNHPLNPCSSNKWSVKSVAVSNKMVKRDEVTKRSRDHGKEERKCKIPAGSVKWEPRI